MEKNGSKKSAGKAPATFGLSFVKRGRVRGPLVVDRERKRVGRKRGRKFWETCDNTAWPGSEVRRD